jgi:hypothetical protein
MLDIIRKKASAWGVKIIFGIIIVVFVFFFGYNRMSQKSGGGKGAVARVNGTTINRPEYNLAYESAYKMYQNIFKGSENGLPEGVEKSVRATAVNQLIEQAVVKSLGKQLNLTPTDNELIDAIRNSPVAKDESGKFDPYLYKQRFLPYFAQKYNLDYEALVSDDIIVEKVGNLFKLAGNAESPKSFYEIEKTKWTFDVTAFDSEETAKSGKGGSTNKYGPLTIRERDQLFSSGDADITVWKSVFSGSKEPLHLGDKWYVVKTTKVEKPKEEEWQKEKDDYKKMLSSRTERETYAAWIGSSVKKAKVTKYIEEE